MTAKKATEGGLALVLILLLFALHQTHNKFVAAAAAGVLLCMVAPKVFTPFAALWFFLSHILGEVMSRVVLTLVYFFVVFPVGFLRRLTGADPMALGRWKKNDGSAFVDRNHTFSKDDIKPPY